MSVMGEASETTVAQLITELRRGHASAPEIARALGISQPTFSRLAARADATDLLAAGRARARRYAARRRIDRLGDRVPLFMLDQNGSARRLAWLHAVWPGGFFVESLDPDLAGGFLPGLPWFLQDLRPQGFLGRLIPRLHPELDLPRDILLWSADHTLTYLARHGIDTVGNLVVGDDALSDALACAHGPTADRDLVPSSLEARAECYAKLAERVLADGPPGSSAGGEQPKFLAIRAANDIATSERRAVLVKFSPPMSDGEVPIRIADLLVAEHVAHTVLRDAGHDAARSELVRGAQRLFLEVERFDRVPLASGGFGRRGVLSLGPIGDEHVGTPGGWADTTAALARHKLVASSIVTEVRWRQLFGNLIANTDMHHGNLAFMMRGTRIEGLAPIYDMLPMGYAPHAGNVREPTLTVNPPRGADLELWPDARRVAECFWGAVANHAEVSERFRAVAAANAETLIRAARYVP